MLFDKRLKIRDGEQRAATDLCHNWATALIDKVSKCCTGQRQG
jgi:hypothetical protein